MKPLIGIIQGRLSPPVKGRIQAFPKDTWEKEFSLSQICGFDAIEWIFECEAYQKNPIWTA
ncbi:MAG: sugar phosphate isomerase/epimerase, partial [Candidatus Omnitrophota bacterium]